MTILLATHDLNTVASHIPWVICFNHGIVAQGTPGVVLNPAILRQTYDADMMVVRQGEMTFIASRSLIHRHVGGSSQGRRSTADGAAG
jgi:zinc/manganese transport system ATP-binding protein/zinc transport system ATP-binding protein